MCASVIKKKVITFPQQSACALDGGNYACSTVQNRLTDHKLAVDGARPVYYGKQSREVNSGRLPYSITVEGDVESTSTTGTMATLKCKERLKVNSLT